jgi:cytochrome c
MRGRTGLIVAACVLAWSVAAASQVASDGIYTTAQAERGEAVYLSMCARCHGDTLLGNDDATPLVGPLFLHDWTGRTMAELLTSIRLEMPTDGPGVLTRREASDVTAFLLQANDFPAGAKELPTSERLLEHVRIEPKKP